MRIKIVNKSDNILPFRATDGSSGYDIKANLREDGQVMLSSRIIIDKAEIITHRKHTDIRNNYVVKIYPFGKVLIPTGLFVEIRKGFHLQLLSRSGDASRGIIVTNSPGVIDSDYRGEIKVLLTNLSDKIYHIGHGNAIAQMILVRDLDISWNVVDELSPTDRGENGFGSTD